jgi:Dolichyl-phosphate-mannose-protein mannosyltransferase
VGSVFTRRGWQEEATRSRSTRALDAVAVGIGALVLRGAWALVYGRVDENPYDALFYELATENLSSGRGFAYPYDQPTAHAPPGFPFAVSLLYRAFGADVELGLALNVVVGAATAVLLYAIARAAFGRAAGLVAGGAFAILPLPIFFTGLYMAETTFLFLAVGVLALAVLLPDRRWTPLVLGVAAGLAALTKGEGALLLVVPLAMWWGAVGRAEWLRRAALLLIAMAVTVLPWTVRNAIEMDSFVPVATNASATLWAGHNSEANGSLISPPKTLLARVPEDLHQTRREVLQAGLLRREAIRWAIRNPHKELGLIPRRLIALQEPAGQVFGFWFNAPGDRQLGTSSQHFFGVVGSGFDYLLLLLTVATLVLVGVRRLWRLHPVMRGALAYLGASLLLYGIVYHGELRFRLPMEPFMILVATPLLVSAPALRGER